MLVHLPLPTDRKYLFCQGETWTREALIALSKIRKPEKEGVFIDSGNPKVEVRRLHSLGARFGFRVTCRITATGVMVWVKSPGIEPNLVKLIHCWSKEKPSEHEYR